MTCDQITSCHVCNKMPTKFNRRPIKNLTLVLYFTSFVALTCLALFICSDYIKKTLVTMEESHSVLTLVMFIGFFIVVSFPLTWGYVVLNLAAGYLYGVINGVLVVFLCALVGISTAHLIIRYFMRTWTVMNIIMNNFRNLVAVVESDHGFKVVVLTRLTPIPFGLQNALFGMCHISYKEYVTASMLGMLPTQTMHAYMGSTLRSMEDVVSNQNDRNLAYLIFIGQFLLIVALFMFVSKKARQLLSSISLEQQQQQLCQQHQYQQQQQHQQLSDVIIDI